MRISTSHPPAWIRYGVAALATILAFVLRIALGNFIEETSPFLLFALAVMVSAGYGGLGPGVLATIAGALLGNYFLLGPNEKFGSDPNDVGRTIVFTLIGLQISWLSGQLRRARLRAEADTQDARRSEQLYRTLANNFPDGFVCLFNASLNWTLLAGAGLEAAGLERDSLEGHAISETLPAETLAQILPLCRAAIAGEPATADVHHRDRFYAAHMLPLHRDGGEHAGMGIFEDITERVRARDALQLAHDTLETRVQQRTAELHVQKTLLESQSQASLDGILVLSEKGEAMFANERFRQLWGLPPGALNVAAVRQSMRDRLVEQQDPIPLDRSPTAAAADGAEELLLWDGRTIEGYSAPIVDPDGHCFGGVWFFRDITERKNLHRQILDASERERQRIGQDLHDDLCQQLTGIACVGRLLRDHLLAAPGGSSDAAEAERIVQMVQGANQRARDLARGLQPIQLQRNGLPTALQELSASVSAMFNIECQFRGDEQPLSVGAVPALHLYRIAQEAISNAVRHGKATRVLVDLLAATDRLILSIEDNGIGIPAVLTHQGLGLHTMKHRARLVGGAVAIERGQPRGTVVTVSVPLQQPSQRERTELLIDRAAAYSGGEHEGHS